MLPCWARPASAVSESSVWPSARVPRTISRSVRPVSLPGIRRSEAGVALPLAIRAVNMNAVDDAMVRASNPGSPSNTARSERSG